MFKIYSEIWVLTAEIKINSCKFSTEIDVICDDNDNNNNDDDYNFLTIKNILNNIL